ncbi:MAG: helix-turn-helix domain-containing GNAT family N-acetyltransferase [Dehalococcoidia bacterium]|nr:helix-turn-helix domain-containing GNAT family N-acetyltransferase [Dehalococcoidia bacterium]
MIGSAVASVRSFNRTVTERIGALEQEYLARGRPLGASRLLWEVGEGEDVRVLRARLGLDSGYLSRLVRQLEAEGLVEVGPSPADRRVRHVSPTPKGRAERTLLDRRSDDLAESILEPLTPTHRTRLVDAMAEVERLLTASAVDLRPVDPGSADATRCLRAYFAELIERSATGLDVDSALPNPDELRGAGDAFVVAYLQGSAVGCCALKQYDGGWAELKRMWVTPRVRGLGLGRRLLAHMESLARQAGVGRLRLDTNEHLVEALAMYRSAGYVDIPRYTDEVFATHWFEKHL